MNGSELNTILSRLDVIETKQEERHSQNVATMSVIFDKLRGLDSLQCKVHDERMKWLTIGVYGLYIAAGTTLFIWVKIALAK